MNKPKKPSLFERYKERADEALMRGETKHNVIHELWAEKEAIKNDRTGMNAPDLQTRNAAALMRKACLEAIDNVVKAIQGESINA